MILIPLPKTKHSRGDQVDNAKYFKSHQFANIIEQSQLNITTLEETIKNTLKNKYQFQKNMKNANNNIGNSTIIKLITNTQL